MGRLATSTAALLATAGAFVVFAGSAGAAIIGNWDGSSRSWNSGPGLVDTLEARSHTVEADGALTAANLADDTVFVIGEATRTTTAQETTDLLNWVLGGGRLLLTVDSGGLSGSGVAAGNAILAALGSALSFGPNDAVNGPLQAGNFLTESGPFDIVGGTLQTTRGTQVLGGTSLADTYVAFEAMGAGFIYAFGDHLQNNLFPNTATAANGQMHINLVEGQAQPQESRPDIPAPATLALVGMRLAGLGFLRRRAAR